MQRLAKQQVLNNQSNNLWYMQTKERYYLMDSKEVYSLFVEIISNPGITFQNLCKKMNKSEGTISQQLKPLLNKKIIIKEGSGKKNHHLILKVSRKGFFDFVISNAPSFKDEKKYFDKWENRKNPQPEHYIDTIGYLTASTNFENLFRVIQGTKVRINILYWY